MKMPVIMDRPDLRSSGSTWMATARQTSGMVVGACEDRIDPVTGQPYPNDDYYYDYQSHSCTYWMANDDIGPRGIHHPGPEGFGRYGDSLIQFISPLITVTVDPITGNVERPVGQVISAHARAAARPRPDGLRSCATTALLAFNPDQLRHRQADEVGDLCDNCPYVPNDDQAETATAAVAARATCRADGQSATRATTATCIYNPDQSGPRHRQPWATSATTACSRSTPHQAEQRLAAHQTTCPPASVPTSSATRATTARTICNPAQTDGDRRRRGRRVRQLPAHAEREPAQLRLRRGDRPRTPRSVATSCDLCPFDGETICDNDTDDGWRRVGRHLRQLRGPSRTPTRADADARWCGRRRATTASSSSTARRPTPTVMASATTAMSAPTVSNPGPAATRDGDFVGDLCDGCPERSRTAASPTATRTASPNLCDRCLFVAFGQQRRHRRRWRSGDACDNCPAGCQPPTRATSTETGSVTCVIRGLHPRRRRCPRPVVAARASGLGGGVAAGARHVRASWRAVGGPPREPAGCDTAVGSVATPRAPRPLPAHAASLGSGGRRAGVHARRCLQQRRP